MFNRYLNDDFQKGYRETHKSAFGVRFLQHFNKNIQVQLWDSAGSESFVQRNPRVKAADAFVILFDVTSRSSFDKIRTIHRENQAISGLSRAREQITLIVGTKADLAWSRNIAFEEA